MTSNQNKASRPGNQGGSHQQHVEAGRQSHKNDASRQSDSLSNQQSGSGSGGSAQSGSRSGAGVQGGTPEQHAAAGRQSHKNDKKR